MTATQQASLIGFATIASADPGRIAVVEPDRSQWTYGELVCRVNQLSHAFAAMRLRPGHCVAAIVPNSRTYYELRLAACQTGLYFTPISHHLTAPEIAYLVADSEATLVIVDASLLGVAGPALDEIGFSRDHRLVVGEAPGWTNYEELLAGFPETAPDQLLAGDFMGYTSGTTGRPKAVRKALPGGPPRTSEFQLDYMARLGIFPGHEVHLVGAPLYHAAPGAFSTIALNLGHTVVVAERPGPEQLLKLVERHGVTVTFTVPTMLHRLLRLPPDVREKYDTSTLRSVVHAAAPCPVPLKRQAIEWLGPVISEFYGATEGPATALTSHEWLTKPGSVGYPLAGLEVRILDALGKPLPAGQIGSVFYTLPTPFEYFKAEEKTASAMRDGLFTAGDVGYLDEDGWLFLCDRRTDLILSGGVNIYPAEIEAALIMHPDVADAAVIGVPDDEWGQRAVAIVQPEQGVAAGHGFVERLTTHCRSMLAGYKVPRTIEFTSQLPRTSAGKLLRRELREAHPLP
ncbi:MAG: AMP-binding protein [Pseudonocardiaceae bacterium]